VSLVGQNSFVYEVLMVLIKEVFLLNNFSCLILIHFPAVKVAGRELNILCLPGTNNGGLVGSQVQFCENPHQVLETLLVSKREFGQNSGHDPFEVLSVCLAHQNRCFHKRGISCEWDVEAFLAKSRITVLNKLI
jgi:hypothetical protein